MIPRKLSTKIIIAVFTGMGIVLLAVSVFAFIFTRAALRQFIMGSQIEIARQSINKIDRLLYERLTDVEAIAGENSIKDYLVQAAGKNEAELSKDVSKRVIELTFVTGPWDLLIVTDRNGNAVLSSEEAWLYRSVKESGRRSKAHDSAMRRETYYSDREVSDDSNQPSMIFAAPIQNDRVSSRPVIGAVIGQFSWPAVLQILEDIPGPAALVNPEGIIIGQNTEYAKAHPSLERLAHTPLLQKLKERHSASAVYSKTEGLKKEGVLISLGVQSGYLTYRGSGWGLVLEKRSDVVFAPATKSAMKLVLLLIPIIVLTSMPVLVMILRWVGRPIKALTQTTREIAAGNLAKKIPVTSRDEMGELAVSFNTMTEKLRRSHEHLEQQVLRRTQELLKTNEALKESENKIRLVIETAHGAFIAMDAKGEVTDWNQQAEKIFGWTRGEIIGKPLSELIIPSQYRQAHRQGLKKYLETGEGPVLNKQIEITALRRDGREFPIELTIWPVKTGGGVSFNAFIRNITERKKTELEIISSRARFQNILDAASDAIISINEDQKIILFNKQAVRIFGYNPEDVLEKPIEVLLPERFRGRHREHVKKFAGQDAASKWMSQRPELFGLRKDGEEFPVAITISKVVMEGKFIFTAIVRDITDQKRLEGVLLQSEKMAAVGQLAGGVAHEINNPLGVILGFAQGVMRRVPPGDPLEMPLKSIEREALRCKQLVQNLLTFSRTGTTEKEDIDANKVITSSLSLVSAQSKVKNVELLKEFSPDLPKIHASRSQLQQVILNLCNNAMDAMQDGGKLTLRTRKADLENKPAVEIQIQDTGHGIPKDLQAKIFEPFFTTKEVGKGTGLGLSLVYEIIQKHEGRIMVESEAGKGALFRIFLPSDSLRGLPKT